MVEIPYWWDRKLSSIAATVYNSRPDLFDIKPEGTPIPLIPPSTAEPKSIVLFLALNLTHLGPSIELFMTATEWDSSTMEPKGWYMTEKYDGMRLYWNGTQFLSRQGKAIKVPESILKQMPSSAVLDGELWTQYGLHQEAVNLGRTTNESKWSKAIYWIFDAPQQHSTIEVKTAKINRLLIFDSRKELNFFNNCNFLLLPK